MEYPRLHRLLQRRRVLGRGNHDDVQLGALLAELLEQAQAGPVRQVDVQDRQFRMQLPYRLPRLFGRMRHAHHLKAWDSFDEALVDLGDHEVVVDHQRADHAYRARGSSASASGSGGAVTGRRTVNTAPPSLRTEISPPRRNTERRTNARPTPRLRPSPSFVLKPSSKTCLSDPRGMPGPESRTSMRMPFSFAWMVSCTTASLRPSRASKALSTRFPTIVTRSSLSSGIGSRLLSGATPKSMPRSNAMLALPTKRAASAGSLIRLGTSSMSVW